MNPLTIEQAIQIAIGHHQAGRLAEAEALYRQVLAQCPDHADALHLLGVLACGTGHLEAAIDLIGRAIASNPAVAEYHVNLGESYRRARRWEGAIASLLRAIELKPDLAHAHYNLGIAFHERGSSDEAISAYRRAIALRPELSEAHNNLGITLRDQGRLDEAIAAFGRAIALWPESAQGHDNLGVALRGQGRLDEAIAASRRAIALRSDLPEAHNNLGNALRDQGQIDEAIAAYSQAVALRPDFAEAHNNLGSALRDQCQLDDAIAAFGRAIAHRPDLAEAHNNLGIAQGDRGRFDLAIAAFGRAIQFRPDYAEAENNLGTALRDQGRIELAIAAFGRAIQLRPDYAEAHNNLGNALRDQGRLDEAMAVFCHAIALRPDLAYAHYNLGIVLQERGRTDQAVSAFDRAIALSPDLCEAHNNLGSALREQGRLDEAIAAYGRAIALRPDLAVAHNNLGSVLSDQRRLDEAIAALDLAIQLEPDYAEAHNNLGSVFKDQGRLDKALACFRRAVELKPDYSAAASNFVYTLHFHPDHDARALLAEHRRWEAEFAHPLASAIQPLSPDCAPDRRLRIGYVSPDFRAHPIGRFILPLLESHDHDQFEIFCYNSLSFADAVTDRCRAHADVWRQVFGQSDEQVAHAIREDRIDILVDLSMHMANNRLLVFARKPAPVQVTYLAYCGTTGLGTMDYRLTDRHLDPPGQAERPYCEESIALPETYWCYQPVVPTAAVNPLPALEAGHVTFGCLNNFCKVTVPTLEAWSRVLQAVPESRLILHAHAGSHRDRVRDFLAGQGIGPDRLTFVGQVPTAEYLRIYEQMDVALDPFPYGGGTTTCDALWMGVPVVTLVGQTGVGRGGFSILANVGLSDLVAHDVEQYVQLCLEYANDIPCLSKLRANLRKRMEKSPLMDAPRFARGVEAAYRTMWHRFCARSA